MDSKTQHTPGPWRASDFQPYLFGAANGLGIDPLGFVYGPSCGEQSEYGRRSLANARLVAAAPELLEALNAFLRAPSIGSEGPGSSTIVVQEFNLRAARAAVAKATGSAA